MKKDLDYWKMVRDIDNLVSTEFCEEVSAKAAFEREITQSEAKAMANIIGKVYLIAHCITCDACDSKYHLSPPSK